MGTETLNMNLQAGRVRVDVNPPAGLKASLKVTSPTATASVRGTSFFFDTMNVSVSEGTVAFKGNSGYTVQVPAGSFSGIGAYSIATAAQSSNTTGFVPLGPPGYDYATTANTGGTGAASAPPAPHTPDKPPPNDPSGGGGDSNVSGWGGGKGGGGGGDTGTVDIPITYK
jgi:hypothetical protein